MIFQSTRPVRGATIARRKIAPFVNDFNPRAPCGARPRLAARRYYRSQISIHAPRAGRDRRKGLIFSEPRLFQSTRPVRGATAACGAEVLQITDFNPRAPCGARRGASTEIEKEVRISIHAPRAGRDLLCRSLLSSYPYFNPRAPCGARHKQRGFFIMTDFISIHAPRAGRDLPQISSIQSRIHFNPRAPCGARLSSRFAGIKNCAFQSTRPVRGATKSGSPPCYTDSISIHAPRAGRDYEFIKNYQVNVHFNPRAPCGARLRVYAFYKVAAVFQSTRPVRGATFPIPEELAQIIISIHAPRAGRDQAWQSERDAPFISIHAPRAGRDLAGGALKSFRSGFQSTRPVRGATAKVYKITLHTFATKGNF